MIEVAKIFRVNGPVVKLYKVKNLKLLELVFVGNDKLLGEVIEVDNDTATVQVYEETEGLKPDEPIYGTGLPLSIELGPGLLGGVFDGVGRPLELLAEKSGQFISRGIVVDMLPKGKKWKFKPLIKLNDHVYPGKIIGETQETGIIKHYILTPEGLEGMVSYIASEGEYTIADTILTVKMKDGSKKNLTMFQRWPVKKARPYNKKLLPGIPLITGERVIDTFFPLAKGGTAIIPGGFGTGKTMTQHALAKWSDADIIVYIGCGERGNEITEVLEDFPKLMDPKSGSPLIERTVIIANTSNMPVAAREASIYTGITIAEYYRDMGYHVAVMADSTSRWAEALREISGRLEEMPAEGGFPSYLPSKLADFYERAGYCETFSGRIGSVSIIGAVSPPGSDFSEPVTQNSLRFTRCFWALDKNLASARHYPAINWITSYSEYNEILNPWFSERVGVDFIRMKEWAMEILQQENRLEKVVKLVGVSSLPEDEKLTFETAKLLREGYLQQNAFDTIDMYADIDKQFWMLRAIFEFYSEAKKLVDESIPVVRITALESVNKIYRIKETVSNNDTSKIKQIIEEFKAEIMKLKEVYAK